MSITALIPTSPHRARLPAARARARASGPQSIQQVIGISKAYTTRVGSGPFPTEIDGPEGETLQREGEEFGATTGRSRRCGWFDAVGVRHAVRMNGMTGIALTKLDVLTGFKKIPICSAYRYKGKRS